MSRSSVPAIELAGHRPLAHGVDAVWRELNNPDALQYCIRQCQSMQRLSSEHFRATLRAGIGPVKVPVSARLEVVPEAPPERFALKCSMSLGVLGESSGQASVELRQGSTGVSLHYRVEVDFTGRIARYGAGFLDEAVDRNLRRFFDRFDEWMHGPEDTGTDGA